MKKPILSAVVCVLALAGCAGGRSLVGKWNVEPGDSMPKGSTATAEFSGADQLSMTMVIKQPLPDGKSLTLNADIKGTYKIDGEKMSMKADTVKFSSPDAPPEIKALMDQQLASMSEDAKKKINEEGVTNFKWVDDNTFTLTGKSGKPQRFTRMK